MAAVNVGPDCKAFQVMNFALILRLNIEFAKHNPIILSLAVSCVEWIKKKKQHCVIVSLDQSKDFSLKVNI